MQRLMLESFEADTGAEQAPNDRYDQGFTAGFEAGQQAAQTTQDALRQELVQSIADLEFKYDEARGEMTRAMHPFLRALVDKIFPHCIETGFADQIVAVLHDAGSTAPDTGCTIRVHPDQLGPIRAAIEQAGLHAAVTADASLQAHGAWIDSTARAYHIDCDQVLTRISDILSSVDFIETGEELHGQPN